MRECRQKKDEQHNSLEAQKDYYLEYIKSEPKWEYVGLYYDDGISGLSKKNRDGFNNLVKDALDGNIDLIVKKSISKEIKERNTFGHWEFNY